MAELLRRGSLCLFLGSGISMSSDEFPSWVQLVKACASPRGINIAHIVADAEVSSLLNTMEQVRDSFPSFDDYKEFVRSKLNESFSLDYHHARNMLLIAIGSLCMPSSRGSINDIITYNFDDLTEWYLNIHGFTVQVVSELPYIHKMADIRIFHPHGFLPKSEKYCISKHFVFDSFEYDLRIGNENSLWFNECKHFLMQKTGVMIGLSCEDPVLTTLVARTSESLSKFNMTRPIAFLLNKSSVLQKKKSEWYYKRGIVPLGFNDFSDIWEFILLVCQRAADYL